MTASGINDDESMEKETNSWRRLKLVAKRRGRVSSQKVHRTSISVREQDGGKSSSSAVAMLKTTAHGKAGRRDMNDHLFVGEVL